jgi:hypothetical protein
LKFGGVIMTVRLGLARHSKAITAEELVDDLGTFGPWLFFAILPVSTVAAALESLATQ